MSMAWYTFESALDGVPTASAGLDALLGPHAPEVLALLGAIGAGDAGPLLRRALAGGPSEREADLDAALRIIAEHADVEALAPGTDVDVRYDEIMQALCVVALIGCELGDDAEIQRLRFLIASIAFEAHIAAVQGQVEQREVDKEVNAARRALARVMQVVVRDLKAQDKAQRKAARKR
ncbi:hypothetical protein KGQ20_43070 [Catenulispora sp. NF23]|uniref:hypothetical protein n=1 Tax=Catenulispora pinistramenti TaxID=2705254 RepID=UPI001BACD271|nr:hypothetical protein [Catenulispora pinistramenti]MBS2539545.1 hypothetical protein [Catenulispora pinistramenti]